MFYPCFRDFRSLLGAIKNREKCPSSCVILPKKWKIFPILVPRNRENFPKNRENVKSSTKSWVKKIGKKIGKMLAVPFRISSTLSLPLELILIILYYFKF